MSSKIGTPLEFGRFQGAPEPQQVLTRDQANEFAGRSIYDRDSAGVCGKHEIGNESNGVVGMTDGERTVRNVFLKTLAGKIFVTLPAQHVSFCI